MVLLKYFRDGAIVRLERFATRELAEVAQKENLIGYPDAIAQERKIKSTISKYSKAPQDKSFAAYKNSILQPKKIE